MKEKQVKQSVLLKKESEKEDKKMIFQKVEIKIEIEIVDFDEDFDFF